MEQNILKIPYAAVNNDWKLLQQFLKIKGNPKYIIVGNIDFSYNGYVSDLGNLVGVEGYLRLSFSNIESLSELQFVGKDLYLKFCKKIKSLGKLKRVEGYLNLENSSIESMGDLEFVGKELWLKHTKIPKSELDKVKIIGGIYNQN